MDKILSSEDTTILRYFVIVYYPDMLQRNRLRYKENQNTFPGIILFNIQKILSE